MYLYTGLYKLSTIKKKLVFGLTYIHEKLNCFQFSTNTSFKLVFVYCHPRLQLSRLKDITPSISQVNPCYSKWHKLQKYKISLNDYSRYQVQKNFSIQRSQITLSTTHRSISSSRACFFTKFQIRERRMSTERYGTLHSLNSLMH